MGLKSSKMGSGGVKFVNYVELTKLEQLILLQLVLENYWHNSCFSKVVAKTGIIDFKSTKMD